MKKILFAVAFALPSLVLADPPGLIDEPPNGKTSMQPEHDQPATARPDDVDMKTKVSKPEPTSAELTSQDIAALVTLHHANESEIAMGKIAKKNGSAKQVKSYGDVLIKDHTLADKQVTAYAKKRGIDLTMPKAKDEAEQAERQAHADTMARLETMKGEPFDREFAKMMVEGHEKAVSLVETTLTSTKDAQLHALLSKLLPVLKEHLKLAEQISATTEAS